MGSAAPATVEAPEPELISTPEPETPSADPSGAKLRAAVLGALVEHQMLAAMLGAGDWRVDGNELVIGVAVSPTIIDMTLGADARRLVLAAASGVLGRPVKLEVNSTGAGPSAEPVRVSANGGRRSRVEQDPIVRRMREKFGAEIRTIIDHTGKR